jgi:hypothetical protein
VLPSRFPSSQALRRIEIGIPDNHISPGEGTYAGRLMETVGLLHRRKRIGRV